MQPLYLLQLPVCRDQNPHTGKTSCLQHCQIFVMSQTVLEYYANFKDRINFSLKIWYFFCKIIWAYFFCERKMSIISYSAFPHLLRNFIRTAPTSFRFSNIVLLLNPMSVGALPACMSVYHAWCRGVRKTASDSIRSFGTVTGVVDGG